MLSPLTKTIEVPCGQKRAFDIFINEMHTWWPLNKFTVSAMGGAPAKTIRIEPKKGGEIVEIGPDNTEHLWGTFKSYNPYEYIAMHFHIPQPGEVVNDRSLVEVRFTVLTDDRTRVELTQSYWEAFGERAKDMKGGYGGGWTMIFEGSYKTACGG